jgi:hypothetical protein
VWGLSQDLYLSPWQAWHPSAEVELARLQEDVQQRLAVPTL